MEALILIIPGLYLLLNGIRLLNGYGKDWFLSNSIYAGGICYAQIPSGIMLLCWAVGILSRLEVFIYLGIGFGFLALIFNFTQPTFLKPVWLKWLESEHHEITDLLVEDSHAMGLDVWQKRVETQAGLETWVAEVRRKHGLHH